MKKPKLNVRLMRRVIKHIEQEPSRLDQNVWLERNGQSPCGTAGCFAGWAVFLTTPNIKKNIARLYQMVDVWCGDNISGRARKRLGLTEDEAADLFHTSSRNAGSKAQVREVVSRAEEIIRNRQTASR